MVCSLWWRSINLLSSLHGSYNVISEGRSQRLGIIGLAAATTSRVTLTISLLLCVVMYMFRKNVLYEVTVGRSHRTSPPVSPSDLLPRGGTPPEGRFYVTEGRNDGRIYKL